MSATHEPEVSESGENFRDVVKNEASCDLALALAILDVLESRWDKYPDELQRVFGGGEHADSNTLNAAAAFVRKAKETIDEG